MFSIRSERTLRFQLRSTFIMYSHLTPPTMKSCYAIISFNRFFTSITSDFEKKNVILLLFFVQFFYFPAQLPSIQWCRSILSGFLAFAYVDIQLSGARFAHRSCTTYRQNVQHKPCLPNPTSIVKQRLQ